jgi:ADP-ribosylglycohydrolase
VSYDGAMMATRTNSPGAADDHPRRPLDETYWVQPGRLLVGAHPGSRSRAQAMDRLRRFLEAGITCFIDLTEPDETPSYEGLLPFETPTGRRVEYLREPIVDHGVPASRETMARILAMLDGALESGHAVYLHCRAGVGRSAMAAGCWLAERAGSGDVALAELAEHWQQAVQSQHWPRVPETDEQVEFVRTWWPSAASSDERRSGGQAAQSRVTRAMAGNSAAAATVSFDARLLGAWYGLALGDALGVVHERDDAGDIDAGSPLAWTQHTAMTLCLVESLLDKGSFDARDQIERYVRWQREELGAATVPGPVDGRVSPDVAKALATYLWRGLPMAGPHDPHDVAATSLPRVLAATTFAWRDPPGAVALGAQCSRTTHQSPLILEACRLYAASLVCALRGQAPATWLEGVPDTAPPSLWATKPLRNDVRAAALDDKTHANSGALRAITVSRQIVRDARSFDSAMTAAFRVGRHEAALYGAVAGTLYGLLHGVDGLPAPARARLEEATRLDTVVARLLEYGRPPGVIA